MNQDNVGVFHNSFSLGENWKDDAETASKKYTENFARVQRFIKRVLDTPELELIDIEVSISIVTKEIDKPVEALDSDFRLQVANGEFSE